eukprot:scaffold20591_cov185-Skeletonema_menzelii.AAC.2
MHTSSIFSNERSATVSAAPNLALRMNRCSGLASGDGTEDVSKPCCGRTACVRSMCDRTTHRESRQWGNIEERKSHKSDQRHFRSKTEGWTDPTLLDMGMMEALPLGMPEPKRRDLSSVALL